MSKKFQSRVIVSNENGLKMDVDDALTAHLLSNPEKKSVISFEETEQTKGKKAQKGNELVID